MESFSIPERVEEYKKYYNELRSTKFPQLPEYTTHLRAGFAVIIAEFEEKNGKFTDKVLFK